MAALFLIFTLTIILMLAGWRKIALSLACINLLLCLAVFWHHVTAVVNILL